MALDAAERDEILAALREAEATLEETRIRLKEASVGEFGREVHQREAHVLSGGEPVHVVHPPLEPWGWA